MEDKITLIYWKKSPPASGSMQLTPMLFKASCAQCANPTLEQLNQNSGRGLGFATFFKNV